MGGRSGKVVAQINVHEKILVVWCLPGINKEKNKLLSFQKETDVESICFSTQNQLSEFIDLRISSFGKKIVLVTTYLFAKN